MAAEEAVDRLFRQPAGLVVRLNANCKPEPEFEPEPNQARKEELLLPAAAVFATTTTTSAMTRAEPKAQGKW